MFCGCTVARRLVQRMYSGEYVLRTFFVQDVLRQSFLGCMVAKLLGNTRLENIISSVVLRTICSADVLLRGVLFRGCTPVKRPEYILCARCFASIVPGMHGR